MRQLLLDIDFKPRQTKGDFFVSSANVDAYNMVFQPATWLNARLIVRGPAKSGKSHLARIWREDFDAEMVPDADAFTQAFVKGDAPLAARLMRPCVFEDCDEMVTRLDFEAQTVFFHLLNAAQAKGLNLLFTSTTPVADWAIKFHDIKSRMEASSQVVMKLPDDALLQAMFVKLFDDKGIRISENAVNYLTLRSARDFESVYRLVEKLDRLSREMSSNVTRAFISRNWDEISS